jgi:hypothetical protein
MVRVGEGAALDDRRFDQPATVRQSSGGRRTVDRTGLLVEGSWL